MGWHAARKLRRSIDALRRVLAIELVTAARALQLRAPLGPVRAERRPLVAASGRLAARSRDRTAWLVPELAAAGAFLRRRLSGERIAARRRTTLV